MTYSRYFCIPILAFGLFACEGSSSTRPASSEKSVDIGFGDDRRQASSAVENLEVAEDLELSLFASEPMVINPTNMDIDEKGRVWVLEARNYRPDYNPHHPTNEEGDTVVILEDTDGDGKADSRKVFYQGSDVDAALGIMVIGNQVVVSSAPNIILLTDDDGDDKADRKEYLFTGTSGIQDDHGLHAFSFGPDGKFYFNAGNGGKYFMHADGSPVKDMQGNAVDVRENKYRQGMAFRTNLDGSEFEVLGHNFRNNYELAVDAFGTIWQSDNDDDGNFAVRINYVMEYGNYGYTDELTGAGWRAPRTGIEENIPDRHWHLNDPGVVPNLLQTGAGSPTGILVYEADLLPERFRGQIIHADAGPHVVRSYPVIPNGAGYTAKTIDIVKEKADKWFRPADVTVAPDGSLFIADWYDATVGGNQAVDNERGRIYRVAPKGHEYATPSVSLTSIDAALQALTSFHHTTRFLAYQELFSKGDSIVPTLIESFNSSDNPRDRARIMWLAARLDPSQILLAFQDENVDVRVAGVRMAKAFSKEPFKLFALMLDDESPQVRRELAIALRHMKTSEKSLLWSRLAELHDGDDRWYLEALGIGAGDEWDSVMQAWLGKVGETAAVESAAGRDIIWRSRSSVTLPLLAEIIKTSQGKESLRYFRSMDFLPEKYKNEAALVSLLSADLSEQNNHLALRHLGQKESAGKPIVKEALSRALSYTGGSQDYLDLLEQFEIEADFGVLQRMAFNDEDASYRSAAARQLLESGAVEEFESRLRGESTLVDTAVLLGRINTERSRSIIERFMLDPTFSLAGRRLLTSVFANSNEGQERILSLAKVDQLPSELKEAAASKLLNAWPVTIRKAAEEVFGVSTKEIPPVRSLMSIGGDPSKGSETFASLCQQCHVVNDEGVTFGPDLSQIGDKLSKYALFEAVLRPSAAITFGYEGVTIIKTDDQQVTGYVTSETSEETIVRVMGGEDISVAKSEIKSRGELDQSLMTPVGSGLDRQSLVDLVAYLEGLKKG